MKNKVEEVPRFVCVWAIVAKECCKLKCNLTLRYVCCCFFSKSLNNKHLTFRVCVSLCCCEGTLYFAYVQISFWHLRQAESIRRTPKWSTPFDYKYLYWLKTNVSSYCLEWMMFDAATLKKSLHISSLRDLICGISRCMNPLKTALRSICH